jgi:hypothetical protein
MLPFVIERHDVHYVRSEKVIYTFQANTSFGGLFANGTAKTSVTYGSPHGHGSPISGNA